MSRELFLQESIKPGDRSLDAIDLAVRLLEAMRLAWIADHFRLHTILLQSHVHLVALLDRNSAIRPSLASNLN